MTNAETANDGGRANQIVMRNDRADYFISGTI
jgi:hypothetical protein